MQRRGAMQKRGGRCSRSSEKRQIGAGSAGEHDRWAIGDWLRRRVENNARGAQKGNGGNDKGGRRRTRPRLSCGCRGEMLSAVE
jgi:hypothetical protein